MRYRVHLVMVHDGGTNTDRSGSFPYFNLFKCTITFLLEHRFTPVIGDIDKRRFELHQGIQMVINRTDVFPFSGGRISKETAVSLALLDMINNLHQWVPERFIYGLQT